MNLDHSRRLSIAPMLDCTDRHERYFLRLISRNILLYSEMVVANAVLHTKPEQFLGHEPFEYPAVLQLGGSNPTDLAQASKLVEAAGFQEVNLNCGCPSDRVQNGNFGACLMKDKNLVADCIKAMQDAVSIPVSIKCRIGVDEFDSWNSSLILYKLSATQVARYLSSTRARPGFRDSAPRKTARSRRCTTTSCTA